LDPEDNNEGREEEEIQYEIYGGFEGNYSWPTGVLLP
jgi:hypothetical protein